MTNIKILSIRRLLSACLPLILLISCSPGPRLTMSWLRDSTSVFKNAKFLVLSTGNSLAKRKIGENALTTSLCSIGFNAKGGLSVFGEAFPAGYDSLSTRQALITNGFDYVITLRVLNVNENNQWIKDANKYTYPGYLYRGFYTYYKMYGLYPGSSFMSTGVKVVLESNIYQVNSGDLIWSGQSMAFKRGPTTHMAKKYAANIIHDFHSKKLIRD